jgi:hypothetical protein
MSTDRTATATTTEFPGERIHLHEGSITLPAEYEDRTVNVLVPAKPQTQANLSIARDWLRPEEDLERYIDRQCQVLQKRLPGYQLDSRDPAWLGSAHAGLEGIVITTRYKNGTQTGWQRQAAFLVAPRRALIFTAASPTPLEAAFDTFWSVWLASFRLTDKETNSR